tara:strand:- start:359 stop:619 length:261 start_codon:yes stop_codon:yes gene_type:complete
MDLDIKPVQWTVEVAGKGDSNFTRFYSEDSYWEFTQELGFAWSDLGLQSYVDYYSITHKGYVDWRDLNNADLKWLQQHNINDEVEC